LSKVVDSVQGKLETTRGLFKNPLSTSLKVVFAGLQA
jgi:hypothetical protein